MEGSFFTFHARDTGNAPSLRASTPAGHQRESPKYKYKYKCKYEYKYKYKYIGTSPDCNALLYLCMSREFPYTLCVRSRENPYTLCTIKRSLFFKEAKYRYINYCRCIRMQIANLPSQKCQMFPIIKCRAIQIEDCLKIEKSKVLNVSTRFPISDSSFTLSPPRSLFSLHYLAYL